MSIIGGASLCAFLLTFMMFVYGSSNRPLYPHILVALPVFVLLGILGGLIIHHLIRKEQKKEGI